MGEKPYIVFYSKKHLELNLFLNLFVVINLFLNLFDPILYLIGFQVFFCLFVLGFFPKEFNLLLFFLNEVNVILKLIYFL